MTMMRERSTSANVLGRSWRELFSDNSNSVHFTECDLCHPPNCEEALTGSPAKLHELQSRRHAALRRRQPIAKTADHPPMTRIRYQPAPGRLRRTARGSLLAIDHVDILTVPP